MNNIAKPIHRIISGLIDFAIFIFPITYIICWFSSSEDYENILSRFWFVVIFLLVLGLILPFFNSFMISTFGGTIGKLLTGTIIVSSNGKRLSFWKAFFRNHIGYKVSGIFLWLGFIWILIDKERRSWHDQIVDTYVLLLNKQMIIFGILILILVSWLNFSSINSTIDNYKLNQGVYKEMLSF